MSDTSSIADLLATATRKLTRSSDSARLDAELLLCHCLQKTRTYLYTWPEHTPTIAEVNCFNSLIDRCVNGEPIAYITGTREFWSETFEVTTDTLIPRPDTEILVEQCLAKLALTAGPFLDLGTGSGVIAISVAKERPDIEVTATDSSEAAIEVAKRNAKNLGATVGFIQSNWFDAIQNKSFDVIASNPPYIAADDPHLQRGGLPFEPVSALQACDNGFSDITAIITTSPAYLRTGGWLLLEHGHTQGSKTRRLMQENGYSNVDTVTDLSGNDRVTLGQKV